MNDLIKLLGIVITLTGTTFIEPELPKVEPIKIHHSYIIYNEFGNLYGMYSCGTNIPVIKPGWRYERFK
jgi:hypothetical protein